MLAEKIQVLWYLGVRAPSLQTTTPMVRVLKIT